MISKFIVWFTFLLFHNTQQPRLYGNLPLLGKLRRCCGYKLLMQALARTDGVWLQHLRLVSVQNMNMFDTIILLVRKDEKPKLVKRKKGKDGRTRVVSWQSKLVFTIVYVTLSYPHFLWLNYIIKHVEYQILVEIIWGLHISYSISIVYSGDLVLTHTNSSVWYPFRTWSNVQITI